MGPFGVEKRLAMNLIQAGIGTIDQKPGQDDWRQAKPVVESGQGIVVDVVVFRHRDAIWSASAAVAAREQRLLVIERIKIRWSEGGSQPRDRHVGEGVWSASASRRVLAESAQAQNRLDDWPQIGGHQWVAQVGIAAAVTGEGGLERARHRGGVTAELHAAFADIARRHPQSVAREPIPPPPASAARWGRSG